MESLSPRHLTRGRWRVFFVTSLCCSRISLAPTDAGSDGERFAMANFGCGRSPRQESCDPVSHVSHASVFISSAALASWPVSTLVCSHRRWIPNRADFRSRTTYRGAPLFCPPFTEFRKSAPKEKFECITVAWERRNRRLTSHGSPGPCIGGRQSPDCDSCGNTNIIVNKCYPRIPCTISPCTSVRRYCRP